MSKYHVVSTFQVTYRGGHLNEGSVSRLPQRKRIQDLPRPPGPPASQKVSFSTQYETTFPSTTGSLIGQAGRRKDGERAGHSIVRIELTVAESISGRRLQSKDH